MASNSQSGSGAAPTPLRKYSLEEIARHNTLDSCWLVLDQRVYDCTHFLSRHPGGAQIILAYAGRDCTAKFAEVHSSSYLTQFLRPCDFLGIVAGSNTAAPSRPFVGRYFEPHDILAAKRTVYSSEHESFRAKFRAFLQHHLRPKYNEYEEDGIVDVDVAREFSRCAEGFYLRLSIPKEYGGLGLDDWRYHAILDEEIDHAAGFFLTLGNDMVLNYFIKSATADQRAYWLPRIVKEARIIAIAMSEPEVGSDLSSLGTRATRHTDATGTKGWLLNGRKMWITSGGMADFIVVAALTGSAKSPASAISLFVVESSMAGFNVAKRLKKIGMMASDTCLLTLENVFVPDRNLIGREGEGFKYLMSNLSKERLSIAIASISAARRALAYTLTYVHGRQMFGGVESQLQSVQQRFAALRTEIQVCTTFIDACITAECAHQLSAETAAMAKVTATELASRVADACLQAYGGYGYMKNNPVARIWVDQRVSRIYGGASEVLLEVIGKELGFKPQRMAKSKL